MSDYETTKRKILSNGKAQFVTGGSRFARVSAQEEPVSKIGVLSNADIATIRMPKVPAEHSRHNYKNLTEKGMYTAEKLKEQGLKHIHEDDIDDSVTHVWYGNKKYPKNSKLFPGDIVELYFPNNPRLHGLLAQVYHVRSFSDWTISAILLEGSMMNTKDVYTVDQYKVVRKLRGEIGNHDYLKRNRTDLLKEDDENIEKL